MFNDIKTDSSIKENVETVGGGGNTLLETGVYEGKIKLAYGIKSDGGAKGVVLHIEAGKNLLKQTIYISNRAGEVFYLDKQTGEKRFLPGYSQINGLTNLVTGKELKAQTVEEKIVKLYDYVAKEEIPTKVPVLVDLLGKPIKVAVFKQIVNKQVKTDSGKYEPTAETREENEIDRFFDPNTNHTYSEVREGKNATMMEAWKEKWTGVTKDKTVKVKGASSTGNAPKQISLFDE